MHWQIKIFTTELIRPVHCLHHVKLSRVIATILGCSRITCNLYGIFCRFCYTFSHKHFNAQEQTVYLCNKLLSQLITLLLYLKVHLQYYIS